MIRMAFFDIDGTLSAPYFEFEGKWTIGVGAEWIEYCVEHGKDTYKDCREVPPVKAYAEELKAEGAQLYALSTSSTSFEHEAKQAFLDRVYPGLFDKLITVSENALKIRIIETMAGLEQIAKEECVLVEDTYTILLEAQEKGIGVMHVSNAADRYSGFREK